jgi:hypothetical protein
MLPNEPEKAKGIAAYLAKHDNFKSHGRFINRDKAREQGLVIEDLESDQKLQDAVLSVFHAATHTLMATGAVKIIENHLGKAFVKAQQQISIGPVGPSFPQPPQQPR